MGQCKVCGKTTKDGLEYCEECQKELDQIDLDAGSFDDLDFSLDDLEFQELSGDLLETDLEFQLEDPENDLENPQIVVREKEEYSELEKRMLEEINKLNIGPQGFGGKTTALAVNIETAPTHIAGLPVAVNICCHVNRHIIREV